MALKYTSIVFAYCCHSVASQTATSWPPSTSVPAAISKIGLVAACSGTAAPPNGAGTIPQNLFGGIQADLNNQNSEISQMIQATCDKGYASKHQQYGSCNGDVCTFAASTPEYTASYTTNAFSGHLDFCLGAPFFIAQHCGVASGNSASPVGGSYASNFNGGGSQNFQSYTFAIKPSNLPFPQCTGDQFQTNEQANVLLAIQSICAADACQLPGEQFGCDRNITQADYVIQAHRQNYGTNDFSNCATAMESIVGNCYEKSQGGGTWALQGQASQEYYALSFQPPRPAPLSKREL